MSHHAAADVVPPRQRTVGWADPRLVAKAGRDRAGLEFLRAVASGKVPPPPMAALLGIDLVSAEAGFVTMRMEPDEHLYNPLGSVHGGAIATLFDTVMGCAVHSTLPLGRGYTTLEIKVNFLRPVTSESGTLTATGQVIHAGRRQAVAEARLTDEAGRLCAVANTTCLLLDWPTKPPEKDGMTNGPAQGAAA